jgi:ribose/xylose/arabinose/galactoside ABC-type transport system permease subunit
MPLTLIALGQLLFVLTRGTDLFLGPVASVAGGGDGPSPDRYPFLDVAAPVLIGLVAGLIDGPSLRLRLPPIIVTLAPMSVWNGSP